MGRTTSVTIRATSSASTASRRAGPPQSGPLAAASRTWTGFAAVRAASRARTVVAVPTTSSVTRVFASRAFPRVLPPTFPEIAAVGRRRTTSVAASSAAPAPPADAVPRGSSAIRATASTASSKARRPWTGISAAAPGPSTTCAAAKTATRARTVSAVPVGSVRTERASPAFRSEIRRPVRTIAARTPRTQVTAALRPGRLAWSAAVVPAPSAAATTTARSAIQRAPHARTPRSAAPGNAATATAEKISPPTGSTAARAEVPATLPVTSARTGNVLTCASISRHAETTSQQYPTSTARSRRRIA